MYIDKSDDIVNKYNNIYHSTIKLKTANVKDNAYIDFDKESNNMDPKFKVGEYVRVSKYKNILAKGYAENLSQKIFMIKKVKYNVP